MFIREVQIGGDNPGDILSLVGKGERYVVAVPSGRYVDQISSPLLHSLDPRKCAILSGSHPAMEISATWAKRVLMVDEKKSVSTVQRVIAARARKWSCNSFLVVDTSFARRFRERDQLKLFSSLDKMFGKAGVRSLWLTANEWFSPRVLTALKDTSEFFFVLSRIGTSLTGQFLKARGVYDAQFFLPKTLTITGDSIYLSSAVIPVGPDTLDAAGTQRNLFAEQYHNIFSSGPEAMIVFDLSGYREVNRKAESLLGYNGTELQQVALSEIIDPSGVRLLLRAILGIRKRGRTTAECTVSRKNGRKIVVQASISSLGSGVFNAGLRDVTDERHAAQRQLESEQELREMTSAYPYPHAVFSNRRLLFANEAFYRQFSWLTRDKKVSISDVLGKKNASLTKELVAIAEDHLELQKTFRKDVAIRKPDETEEFFELSARGFVHDGKRAIQCAFVNVSDRRHILDVLAGAEERYRSISENSRDAVSVSCEGKIVYANRAFLQIVGYTNEDDVLGKPLDDFLTAKSSKELQASGNGRRVGEVTSRELTLLRHDKTRILVETHLLDTILQGKPATVAFHHDLTRHNEAVEELARKAQNLQLREDISFALSHAVELDELWKSVLQALIDELAMDAGAAYALDEASATFVMKAAHALSDEALATIGSQPVNEGITGYVAKTLEPLLISVSEYPAFLPYRSLFEHEGFRRVVYIPILVQGSIEGQLLLASRKDHVRKDEDLSLLAPLGMHIGRAVADAKLYTQTKVSEERYRSAVENISDVIYNALPNGQIQFVGPNVEQLLGFKPADFYRSPDLWRTLIHPDDRTKYFQRISNQADPVESFHLEYRMLPKGRASYRWLRDSIRYKRHADGTLISINGVLSDITDRMLLEDALLKSEELKSNVLESIQEGVVVFDTQFRYLDWNKAMEHITGVSRDTVLGKSVIEGTSKLANETVLALLRRALSGDVESSDYIPFTLPTMEDGELWVRFSPLRDSGGVIAGVVGIMSDVTTKRRLERDVKESEETLRNVIDAMGDALMISDLQGRVWEVNREFTRITGYPRTEVLGSDFPYPWLVEEEMSRYVMWISELREKSYLRDFDMTWRTKDNRDVDLSINTTLLQNAFGEPVAMLNIARDISERKRLGRELEHKNRQIELLNRIISYANSTMEFGKIFERIAKEVKKMIPFDAMTVALLSQDDLPTHVYSCSIEEDGLVFPSEPIATDETIERLALERRRAMIKDELAKVEIAQMQLELSPEVESQITIPFFFNDKALGTFSITSFSVNAFSRDDLTFLQPIADQFGTMLDRVRLFQRVSDDSKYIHNLLNSIDSVVYTIDRNYRITEVNKAWEDFARRKGLAHLSDEHAVIGLPLEKVITDPDEWQLYQTIMQELFTQQASFHSREFELGSDGDRRIYQLVINPMEINKTVTGLVFTHTDITQAKRTEEEIKRRNKELLALNAIATSISTSLNLQEVLTVAAEQLRDSVGADLVFFYLFDSQSHHIALASSVGIPDEGTREIQVLKHDDTLTGTVISDRAAVHVQGEVWDEVRISAAKRNVLERSKITDFTVIPLQSKEDVLGTMEVGFVREGKSTTEEQQILSLVGNQVGAAVENAQLYSQVQAQVQRITTLYELGKGLTGVLDVTNVLQIVYGQMVQAIPFDAFEYHQYMADTDSLVLVSEIVEGCQEFYRPGARVKELQLSPGSSYAAVMRSRTTYFGPGQDSFPEKASLIAVPIRAKQDIVGVLSVSSKAPDAYNPTHLRLVESIANLTGIAIDKAMLYEDTVNKSVEIENRNRELDDFTYVVSHDLKEPLISIEGYSKILLKDYNDRVDDEGKEYLSAVIQSTSRMKHLINDLLTLSRLGRLSEPNDLISVKDVINEILYDLQFTLREKHVSVNVPDELPTVRFNPTQLSMVFRNLISNSMKFNDKPNPFITIDVREKEHEFVFSVTDNGIGIEEQYYDKIFMIFQRLKRSDEYRGTGAGLTIVKKIVEKEHGRIWVDSVLGEKTTFYFTIAKQ